ncbi:hypothetical protein GCM10023334_113800 [Nonomuraea thailandensis]
MAGGAEVGVVFGREGPVVGVAGEGAAAGASPQAVATAIRTITPGRLRSLGTVHLHEKTFRPSATVVTCTGTIESGRSFHARRE